MSGGGRRGFAVERGGRLAARGWCRALNNQRGFDASGQGSRAQGSAMQLGPRCVAVGSSSRAYAAACGGRLSCGDYCLALG